MAHPSHRPGFRLLHLQLHFRLVFSLPRSLLQASFVGLLHREKHGTQFCEPLSFDRLSKFNEPVRRHMIHIAYMYCNVEGTREPSTLKYHLPFSCIPGRVLATTATATTKTPPQETQVPWCTQVQKGREKGVCTENFKQVCFAQTHRSSNGCTTNSTDLS